MVGWSEGFNLLTGINYACRWTSKYIRGLCRRQPQPITFDMLPDDVLLEIFNFYVHEDYTLYIQEWIRLAHVCRRWRSTVFQSPVRLNLRFVCTPFTPATDVLDIWPPFPLVVRDYDNFARPFTADNIIAALEHNDRVCKIELKYPQLEYLTDSEVLLKPFPELASLRLSNVADEEPGPILPDSSLGGSAPRLRSLFLEKVSFPRLSKFLLSATHLVDLDLLDVPRSGYITPEVMATSLSALTSLKSLRLSFRYPPPRPFLTRHPPPLTRSILPSLTKIQFKGASEYLELILSRIDAPRLDKLHITFFNQLIFDTPQLFQLISRRPTLTVPEKGHIRFHSEGITVNFFSQSPDFDVLDVAVWCTPSEWQLSSLEQVCTLSLPPVSTLEYLYISESKFSYPRLHWQADVENTLWLDLLRSFVAVKNLYISDEFVPRIAPAMQELVGGRSTEVLPSLENIFLQDSLPSRTLQEGIEKFVAARLLAGHPVTVSRWDRYAESV